MNAQERKPTSLGFRMLNQLTDTASNLPDTTTSAEQHCQTTKNMDLLIIAGEPSGDMHAAKWVKELKSLQPNLAISAMGGDQLAAAGATLILNAKDLALVGFIEVIKEWRKIHAAFKTVKKIIREQRPKVVVLVDYPGFNLRMAKFAKQHGCHVIYYIAPQVWAWHKNRVHKIKRWVDVMAVIFPFEVDFFKRYHVSAQFVGHPLAAEPLCSLTTEEAKRQLNLNLEHPVIGLIPGSRRTEVQTILPPLLAAATKLHAQNPALQFVLPKASNIDTQWLNDQLAQCSAPITVTAEHRYITLQACDITLAASGTVTLELALLEIPMIIAYKTNPLTFWLGKQLVNLKHLGLPNIIAQQTIVPELLQENLTAENIVTEVNQLLSDPTRYALAKTNLAKIHQALQSDATKKSLTQLLLQTLQS